MVGNSPPPLLTLLISSMCIYEYSATFHISFSGAQDRVWRKIILCAPLYPHSTLVSILSESYVCLPSEDGFYFYVAVITVTMKTKFMFYCTT